jgi:hypothetical protein
MLSLSWFKSTSRTPPFKGVKVEIPVFYDKREKETGGDGFYPSLEEGTLDGTTTLTFVSTIHSIKQNYGWKYKEEGGFRIYGLDGNTGENLLKSLNNKGNFNGTFILGDGEHHQLYPKMGGKKRKTRKRKTRKRKTRKRKINIVHPPIHNPMRFRE